MATRLARLSTEANILHPLINHRGTPQTRITTLIASNAGGSVVNLSVLLTPLTGRTAAEIQPSDYVFYRIALDPYESWEWSPVGGLQLNSNEALAVRSDTAGTVFSVFGETR